MMNVKTFFPVKSAREGEIIIVMVTSMTQRLIKILTCWFVESHTVSSTRDTSNLSFLLLCSSRPATVGDTHDARNSHLLSNDTVESVALVCLGRSTPSIPVKSDFRRKFVTSMRRVRFGGLKACADLKSTTVPVRTSSRDMRGTRSQRQPPPYESRCRTSSGN